MRQMESAKCNVLFVVCCIGTHCVLTVIIVAVAVIVVVVMKGPV